MIDRSLLHVLVGSSPLNPDDPRPNLVVEAEPERIEELRQSLVSNPFLHDLVPHQGVLAAASQLAITWYRYSDPRFNGVVPLKRWQEFYPNLTLEHEETIASQTLAEVLDQCSAIEDDQQDISLILRQGDPVEVLKGADRWLHRFRRIELQGPKVDVFWVELCGRWLEQQGFSREPDSGFIWVLDDQALQLIQQANELKDLKDQHSKLLHRHQEELEKIDQRLIQADQTIASIFPYTAYREKRPDLRHLSDHDLILHFLAHGREEGTQLNYEHLRREWEENAAKAKRTVFWHPVSNSLNALAPPRLGASGSELSNSASIHPEPTAPAFRPLTETKLQAWLVDSRLFVSSPEDLTRDFSPAIYRGNEGFSLTQIQWAPDIRERLKTRQSHRLFATQNQDLLAVLSDSRDSRILDSGLNQLPSYTLLHGQTLHVHLSTAEEAIDLPLLIDFEINCENQEVWSFEALLACHRAMGSLVVTTTHQGRSKTQAIAFDTRYAGGQECGDYQSVKLDLQLEPGTNYLTLSIRHGCIYFIAKDVYDCYYFITNPLFRYCGHPGQNIQGLVPRALGSSQDLDSASWLFSSTVTPFFSPAEPNLVLDLGNGICHELFSPLEDVVTLIADHSHSLEVKAHPGGEFALYVNGTYCRLVTLSSEPTSVMLPYQWLRGEPALVEIRDTSGSQVHIRHTVMTPRFLTPRDVILYQAKPPYPTNLNLRIHQRYQSLRRHLQNPIEGLRTEMLEHALETLERDFQQVKLAPLEFPVVSDPEVSIIIPSFNHVQVTYYALCALLLAHNKVRFEIVLVDDGSTDETSEIEKWVKGVRVIRNEKPLRFIHACNKGVSEARGRFVVLLNNDTEVSVGWLDALVDGFHRFENVGLVGSKLLRPDGSLQDAGGIVWGSGNPSNYGYGQNPWEPRFCYARQVDYLSGAALMTTKAIWDEVGGLSRYLEPMYFEDTDFSFKVREAGYKTYFIPASIVYHYEGTTSGVDPTAGFKMYQEINRPKFKRAWAKAFASHGVEGDQPDLEKDRGIKGRILFIDYNTPREDQDAGSYAAIREMELVQSLGYKVTFLPQNLYFYGEYTEELMRNGIEVITSPFYLSLGDFIPQHAKEYDAAYITRYSVAAEAAPLIREHSPKTRILLNNADLHFLRQLRSAVVNNDEEKMAAMRSTREQELDVMKKVDLVLSYNEVEHAVITSHTDGQVKVMKCPWVVSIPATIAPLSERKGLCFLANFDFHPNTEGLKWFCKDVMPMLAEHQLQLTIYGSNLGDQIKDLANEWIIPFGHVKDVADVYQKHRVFIAPLLSGAGVKGKVVSALAYGIPTVLTPVAAEGIGLRHGVDCLIARNPEEWVSAILTLCYQDDRWHALSRASRDYAASHFSFQEGRQRIKEAFEAIDLYNHMEC
jgi:GT2 family glycosyltransferase